MIHCGIISFFVGTAPAYTLDMLRATLFLPVASLTVAVWALYRVLLLAQTIQ